MIGLFTLLGLFVLAYITIQRNIRALAEQALRSAQATREACELFDGELDALSARMDQIEQVQAGKAWPIGLYKN